MIRSSLGCVHECRFSANAIRITRAVVSGRAQMAYSMYQDEALPAAIVAVVTPMRNNLPVDGFHREIVPRRNPGDVGCSCTFLYDVLILVF